MRDGLDFLLDEPVPPADSFRWATVTGVSPLRIRFDADTVPLAATPATLVPVVTGDRVWTQLHKRMVVILGRVPRSRDAAVMATGTVSVPVGGSWQPVSLPAGRFTQPPVVTVTVNDANGASMGITSRVSSVTSSGFNVHLNDTIGTIATEARINWIAVQMTA